MDYKLTIEETETLHSRGYVIKDNLIFVYDATEDCYYVAELVHNNYGIELNADRKRGN